MERVLVYGMTNNPGGIESYLLETSFKIKKYGIQFDFVSDFDSMAYAAELKENGSRLYFIPAKGKKLFQHLGAMRKLLKDHPEYKTVYFNILDAGAAFTAAVPWFMGRKIVVHSHNGATEKVLLHKMCRPFLNRMTDQGAACSRLASEYMFGEKYLSKKETLIIPNAIDVDKYEFNKDVRERYRNELGVQNQYVVCHVGRITEQKNPFRIIDIFSALYNKDKSAVLLYAGTGELHEQLVAYIRQKECSENVKLLGVRSDIAQIMQAADVFLLPSLYEGLPIVAVEAQAAGLPAVLSQNITREVDITGNISFLSLDSSDSVWAEELLRYKEAERMTCRDKFRQAGYDRQIITEDFKKLVECFGGERRE